MGAEDYKPNIITMTENEEVKPEGEVAEAPAEAVEEAAPEVSGEASEVAEGEAEEAA